ncbi:hypothetical protein B0H94_11822 [Salsuginibacillus halophilus]|uniref:Uncharacterized protein n=1 Tax=Salsuginibacillus halophilus TaxID=517424 RepID=A0A2P8H684_9BACI|nr:hypothetical protein [Salsuginibacillus halophilus]PSL41709.1 hypothetical protein B0H94_11822 [Salsuginibacillus halophilus]
MPKMRRGNRIVNVSDQGKNSYLKSGYDEIDSNGKVITQATGGKSVSIAEYNKVKSKVDKLEEQNAELQKENKSLKAENTKLKKGD